MINPPLTYAEQIDYLDRVRRVISNEATAEEKLALWRDIADRFGPQECGQ